MTDIHKHIPKLGVTLAKYSGSELIERLGEDIIKDVVISILCGGNVRSLTEGLTQRRVSLSNAAMLIAHLKSGKHIKDFTKKMPQLVAGDLQKKLSGENKIFLQWFIGLTGKSIQNVLRGDSKNLDAYLEDLDKMLSNSVKQSIEEFGDLTGQITIDNENYLVNWPSLLQLFLGIGTQTLALRGSEKSMYGKLFEKLILGSLLEILGFKYIDPSDTSSSNLVFWLSQREDKRESDATLLVKQGVGARFDIGFIGPGNSEISLDKVSRFEREMEFGRSTNFMSTIIIVDRIGEGSRISELAGKINGNIVQMSMNYWIKEVADILHKNNNHYTKLVDMTQEESLEYIREKMKGVDLNKFAANQKLQTKKPTKKVVSKRKEYPESDDNFKIAAED
jgi:hypothetical protein